ncbi:PIN domain-containing protein [Polaromonas sp.]|uniref:PIN domain-containing protein n=1 Tax=Polaromonas sp. TaxID=1869339 RepID=UPI003563FED4
MRTQIILVDFENVQPDLLPALAIDDVQVHVFVGPHQTRLATNVVIAMQELGARAKYVRVAKQGPDALDMHLAFYLGELSQQFPDAFFHIVAKDRDYDSLLAHLRIRGIYSAKAPDLAAIPLFKRALAIKPADQLSAAADWLRERVGNRPSTQATLKNNLKKVAFAERLDEAQIDEIFQGLVSQGFISVEKQKVLYQERLNA